MKSKWSILCFLCGTFVVYTIDRAAIGILAIPIQKDLGISDIQFGVLNAAIFWTYAAIVPIAGIIGDRFNRAKLIAIASTTWSLMMILAGFATGFYSLLLIASVALVIPQTMYGPSANALIASAHSETRTTALSCHQASFYTGWFISGAFAALVLSCFGSWRSVFFVFGAIGLVVAFAFSIFVRRTGVGNVEARQKGTVTITQSLKAFFGCPSALLAGSGYVAVVFVGFGYSAWGPKFVAQKFGITPAAAGTGVMFWHYAAAFAAIFTAGLITDWLVKKWPRFRLALQSGTLLLASPFVLLFGLGESVMSVWIAAAGFGVMRGLFEANAFTSLFDVVAAEHRASSVGFLNVIAGTVGSFAPIMLGAMSERHGIDGLSGGFVILSGVLALGAVMLLVSLLFTFNRDRLKQ